MISIHESTTHKVLKSQRSKIEITHIRNNVPSWFSPKWFSVAIQTLSALDECDEH